MVVKAVLIDRRTLGIVTPSSRRRSSGRFWVKQLDPTYPEACSPCAALTSGCKQIIDNAKAFCQLLGGLTGACRRRDPALEATMGLVSVCWGVAQ